MSSVLLAVLFFAMILAPCVIDLGGWLRSEPEEDDETASGTEAASAPSPPAVPAEMNASPMVTEDPPYEPDAAPLTLAAASRESTAGSPAPADAPNRVAWEPAPDHPLSLAALADRAEAEAVRAQAMATRAESEAVRAEQAAVQARRAARESRAYAVSLRAQAASEAATRAEYEAEEAARAADAALEQYERMLHTESDAAAERPAGGGTVRRAA